MEDSDTQEMVPAFIYHNGHVELNRQLDKIWHFHVLIMHIDPLQRMQQVKWKSAVILVSTIQKMSISKLTLLYLDKKIELHPAGFPSEKQ